MVAIVTLMLIASAAIPIFAADGMNDGSNGQNGAMPGNGQNGTMMDNGQNGNFQNGQNGMMHGNDRFNMTMWNGTGQGWDQNTMMRQFMSLPDKSPLFFPMNNDNGNVSGRYISFMGNPANGMLQNYALNVSGKNTPIFTSIMAPGFTPTTWNVSGPLFMSADDNLAMFAADNPMGTFHVAAANSASVNLSMPAGFTAAPMASSNAAAKAWSITGNGITGVMVVHNGTAKTNLGPAGTAGYFNASMTRNGEMIFRALPVAGGFPLADERFLMSQLANWSIEGEMALVTASNNTLWYATEEGSMVPMVNASQGMVTVNLTQGTQNGANLTAQASGQRMWYVITMDKNTINPANGTPQVMINGQSLKMANSSSELATSTTSFWMYQGTNASVLVVPLPANNASVGIEVKEGTQNPSSATTSASSSAAIGVGIVIVGVVVLVGAVIYFRRKK